MVFCLQGLEDENAHGKYREMCDSMVQMNLLERKREAERMHIILLTLRA